MAARKSPRRQCANCPWKKGANPRAIHGYDAAKHRRLASTIAEPERIDAPFKRMTCHESMGGPPIDCAGWIANQLGPGNNLGLRFAVMTGTIDGNVRAVGPQHERLEDTFPEGA